MPKGERLINSAALRKNIRLVSEILKPTTPAATDSRSPKWEIVPPISPEQKAADDEELRQIEARIYRGNAATNNAHAK